MPQADLLPIAPLRRNGSQFGLHPTMAAIQELFDSARIAFVANVGPLIEPTTKEHYENGSVALPPRLFSHNDQQDQWQSLRGRTPGRTGWAGRIGDLLRQHVTDQQLATNVSLAGNQLFQAADETVAYTMGRNGPLRFQGLGTGGRSLERRLAFERVLGADYDTMYERAFRDIQQRAVETVDRVSSALADAQPLSTVIPGSALGSNSPPWRSSSVCANSCNCSARSSSSPPGDSIPTTTNSSDSRHFSATSANRSVPFTARQWNSGYRSSVTTFTQSDFGRTLTSNGDGTDHGWGGVQLVVGDAVRGRELYGTYPRLEIGGPDDVRRGRLIPSVSADQYAATLAKWIGVPEADLTHVAPHLDNFIERDLGFMV